MGLCGTKAAEPGAGGGGVRDLAADPHGANATTAQRPPLLPLLQSTNDGIHTLVVMPQDPPSDVSSVPHAAQDLGSELNSRAASDLKLPRGSSSFARKPSTLTVHAPSSTVGCELHSPESYIAAQEREQQRVRQKGTSHARGVSLDPSSWDSTETNSSTGQSLRWKTQQRTLASDGSSTLPAPTVAGTASASPNASPILTALRPTSRANAPSPFPRSGSGFGGANIGGENSKADFLAFMAHELRNPLHNIMGATELLLSSPVQPEQRELLESVALSSQLMSRIVDDVLDLGKMKAGHMELELMPFDLLALLRDLERMYTRIRSNNGAPNVEWAVRVHENLTNMGGPAAKRMLIGDATRLMQILTNLLSNAFKFCQRGSVRLFVRAVSVDEDGNATTLPLNPGSAQTTPPSQAYSRVLPDRGRNVIGSDPPKTRTLQSVRGPTADALQQSASDGVFPRPESRNAAHATILDHLRVATPNHLQQNSPHGAPDRAESAPLTPPQPSADPARRAGLIPPSPQTRALKSQTSHSSKRDCVTTSPLLQPVTAEGGEQGGASVTVSPADGLPLLPGSAVSYSPSLLYVEFTIEDTGLGICGENLPKLFEDYTQAKVSIAREFGGTGLGLSIVRTLVDLMHGSLRVSSELGAGTSFTFCVPFSIMELNGAPITQSPSTRQHRLLSPVAVASPDHSPRSFKGGAPVDLDAEAPNLLRQSSASRYNALSPASQSLPVSPANAATVSGLRSGANRFDFGQLQSQRAVGLRGAPTPSSRVSYTASVTGEVADAALFAPQSYSPEPWQLRQERRNQRESVSTNSEKSLLTRALLGSARRHEFTMQLPSATTPRGAADPDNAANTNNTAAAGTASGTNISPPGLVSSLSSSSAPSDAAIAAPSAMRGQGANPFPALAEEDANAFSPYQSPMFPRRQMLKPQPEEPPAESTSQVPSPIASAVSQSLFAAANAKTTVSASPPYAPVGSSPHGPLSPRAESPSNAKPPLHISVPRAAVTNPTLPEAATAQRSASAGPSTTFAATTLRSPHASAASASASQHPPNHSTSAAAESSNAGAASAPAAIADSMSTPGQAGSAFIAASKQPSSRAMPASAPADQQQQPPTKSPPRTADGPSPPTGMWGGKIAGADSIRVLLVEDNVPNQKLGKFMLSKRGFQVVVASDGVEAVDTVMADGASRRAAVQSGTATGAATSKILTLTANRSSGGTGSAAGSGSVRSSMFPAASTDNSPSDSGSSTPQVRSVNASRTSVPAASSHATTTELSMTAPASSDSSTAATAPADATAPSSTTASSSPTGSPFDASYSGFEVILMDVNMPRMSGLQATQLLRAAGFQGRIIALTASDSMAQRQACLDAGMDGFLTKPFKADDMVSTVMEQHRLTHADPPMPPRAGKGSSASSMPSASPPAPLRSRAVLTSSGPMKHTIVVRAKPIKQHTTPSSS